MEWHEKHVNYCNIIEENIPHYIPGKNINNQIISEAMVYSLEGGKRIRGALCLLMNELCNGSQKTAIPFAIAIEMIHAYSLIHDDLPCMDNDELRRGKPTCHIQFGEANALLTGDALLTCAFDIMTIPYYKGELDALNTIKAIHVLSKAAGLNGMIGGQALDISNNLTEISDIELMHSLKTGALIKASAEIGVIIANGADDLVLAAGEYAKHVGLAFQIVDDILDVTRTEEELGKSTSDIKNNKKTIVNLIGLEKSQELIKDLLLKADLAIKGTALDNQLLYQCAEDLAKRNN